MTKDELSELVGLLAKVSDPATVVAVLKEFGFHRISNEIFGLKNLMADSVEGYFLTLTDAKNAEIFCSTSGDATNIYSGRLFPSYESFAAYKDDQYRRSALAKLTASEKKALGM